MRRLAGVACAIVLCAGCGDDKCGTGGAPATLVASGGTVTLTYGALSGSPNNDCPAADAPAGVTSLTIMGSQTGGTGSFTLCIGRPDLLDGGLTLGTDVAVVDTSGSLPGCTGPTDGVTIDRAAAITGTAKTAGLCDAGTNAAGFALTIDGALTLTRTCGAAIDSVPITIDGTVAVAGPPT